MDDAALLLLAQCGDADALERLVRLHYPPIHAFCLRRTGDAVLADDVTQETFLRMIQALPRYHEQGRFRSWLFTIAANLCRDAARRAPSLPLPDATGPDFAGAAERALLVRAALRALPAVQQEAVLLFYYHDFSLRDISRIQRAPVPTVKTRLRRGLARMRDHLQKEGFCFDP